MYTCLVTKIKTSPIPNAETIQKANCSGYQCIVGKNHKDGELGIFFPSDGQISTNMAKANKLCRMDGGYLESNRRVKTIKLMGIHSEGIWLPLSSLEWITTSNPEFVDSFKVKNFVGEISDLKEGDSFTHFNGISVCKKYRIRKQKVKGETKPLTLREKIQKRIDTFFKKGVEKTFPKHYDTEKIQHMFADKHIPQYSSYFITQKVHGTSQRSGYVKRPFWFGYKYFLGTRNTVKSNEKSSEQYRNIAHEIIRSYLRKGEVFYYEIVGYGERGAIMPPHKIKHRLYPTDMYYSYGMKPVSEGSVPKYEENFDIYVYRITQDGRELDYLEMLDRLGGIGIKPVPHIETGYWNSENLKEDNAKQIFLDHLATIADAPNGIDPSHISEGVCVRFETTEGQVLVVKYKSWLFCDCEGIAKNSDTYHDPEDEGLDEE